VIIQEFYDSGEIDEAVRCLKELHVPHFHHEFIYEGLDFIIQKGDDYAVNLITNLFKRLYDSVTVTYDQLKMVCSPQAYCFEAFALTISISRASCAYTTCCRTFASMSLMLT
jgi:hypothetical protein